MIRARILVYGAGVLGGLLAHSRMGAPNANVTLRARGAWADALERNGLRIRHYAQRKTTVDRPLMIRELVGAQIGGGGNLRCATVQKPGMSAIHLGL